MDAVDSVTPEANFFIAGGTLPLQSGSYLERAADVAIVKALCEGRFCYVLNSRQMGKSSLCVRAMPKLLRSKVVILTNGTSIQKMPGVWSDGKE
jgi:hypothetical protein